MTKHYLQGNGKYRMYEIESHFPLAFCSSVASARKSVQSVGRRPKINPELMCYLNNIGPHLKNIRPKSRNQINETTSAAHIPEFKSTFKRMGSQKAGAHKKLKLKKSSRLYLKHCCFNIHTSKPKVPQSTKQQDKPLGQKVFEFPQPFACFNMHNDETYNKNEDYKNLVNFLENTRMKSGKLRSTTPNNQFSKQYMKKNNYIDIEQKSNDKYVPYTNSVIHKDIYERKLDINRIIQSNTGKYGNDDPYKIMAESVKARNPIQIGRASCRERVYALV